MTSVAFGRRWQGRPTERRRARLSFHRFQQHRLDVGFGFDSGQVDFAIFQSIDQRPNDFGPFDDAPGRLSDFDRQVVKEGDFPVTEAQAKSIITLPVHQHLTEAQLEYVIETFKEFYCK